jgi:hypothetical protein
MAQDHMSLQSQCNAGSTLEGVDTHFPKAFNKHTTLEEPKVLDYIGYGNDSIPAKRGENGSKSTLEDETQLQSTKKWEYSQ